MDAPAFASFQRELLQGYGVMQLGYRTEEDLGILYNGRRKLTYKLPLPDDLTYSIEGEISVLFDCEPATGLIDVTKGYIQTEVRLKDGETWLRIPARHNLEAMLDDTGQTLSLKSRFEGELSFELGDIYSRHFRHVFDSKR